jgi:putative hemolysin
MADLLPQIILVVILIILNAAFAGTELALVSLREGQIQRLEARSSTGALLARLARQPNQFLATIQIGITLAGFLASAAAAVSLSEPLEEPLGFLGNAAGPASIVVVTLILSYLTLVFGELAPKRIAMQRAERWGLAMARPLSVLSTLTRPVVWLLSKSTDLVVRLAGADPEQQREEVTEEELRELVAGHETVTPHQRRIIDGAFEISERTLGEVMLPRGGVFVVAADDDPVDALRALADSGHTRAPVVRGQALDDVVGVVHMRDLLDTEGERNVARASVESLARPAPVFPDSARVLTAMRQLQIDRVQMAIVVSERGRVVGIVTMEDLVEELVGEIYDETDPDLAMVHRESDGTIVVPGPFPVHEVADLGFALPHGSYATVAGLILDRLKRLPSVGDVVVVDDVELTVRGRHRHAITQVALVRRETSSDHLAPVDGDD